MKTPALVLILVALFTLSAVIWLARSDSSRETSTTSQIDIGDRGSPVKLTDSETTYEQPQSGERTIASPPLLRPLDDSEQRRWKPWVDNYLANIPPGTTNMIDHKIVSLADAALTKIRGGDVSRFTFNFSDAHSFVVEIDKALHLNPSQAEFN